MVETEALVIVSGHRYTSPEGGNDAGDGSVRSRKCRWMADKDRGKGNWDRYKGI